MSNDVRREELLCQLDRFAGEADSLRARRSSLTYQLVEQVVSERDRLKRHLVATSRREKGEGGAA